MKALLLFTLTLVVFPSQIVAQDTTYYDLDRKKLDDSAHAHYYRVQNTADSTDLTVHSYFMSGQIKSKYSYFSNEVFEIHGERKEWYENGQVKWNAYYAKGELHGEVFSYWKNGELKRQDTYNEGKLVEGSLWDKDGKRIEHYNFEITAAYKGGKRALIRFLNNNLEYPEKSLGDGIEGKVLLSFLVEKNGSVSNIKIIDSANAEMDKEAIRVLEIMGKMKNWSPGMLDGEHIVTEFRLPIAFILQD